MDILVLDVGCTHMKAVVVRAQTVIEKIKVNTPQLAEGIVRTAKSFVDRVFSQGYELQGVIPISFSESIISETDDGRLRLWGPTYWDDDLSVSIIGGDYEKSGYPDVFPGVYKYLSYIDFLSEKQDAHFKRVLPVSTMIAAQLVGNRGWNMWDCTHASNTGLYGDGQWLSEASEKYSRWFDTKRTVTSYTEVGRILPNIPVFAGGHDTLLAMFPKHYAYISCGTYIIASQPTQWMQEVKEDYPAKVRYLQSPTYQYQRQLCMKSKGRIDHDQINEIRQFMTTDDVVVMGNWASEMAEVLVDYSFNPVVKTDEQFIGAAAAAQQGVYDRQNIGSFAA